MAVEDDILKTLIRIEKALGNGSVTSGLGRTTSIAGGADRDRSDGRGRGRKNQPYDRDENGLRKSYRATSASLNTLSDSSAKLNLSFTGLNKTILITRSNFVAMNRTMRAMARPAGASPAPTGGQQRLPADADIATPGRRARAEPADTPGKKLKPGVSTKINTDPWKFFSDSTNGNFLENFAKGIRDGIMSARPRRVTPEEQSPAEEKKSAATAAKESCITLCDDMPGKRKTTRTRATPPPRPVPPRVGGTTAIAAAPAKKTAGALDGLTDKAKGATSGLWSFTVALAAAIIPLTRDILYMHSVGIQASSALGGLYIDAARSGMSLRDYTKVLQASSAAVTRAGSMDDFNTTLQVTRDRLQGLGIFGEEATKLSASLANSTTALGVPQDQLNKAMNAQISTFEQLRRTSLVTAEEFQKLTESLAGNQTVQSQLLGMAPAQRAARFTELTQIKTIGLSLGATKAASDALGDALIATRNLTAPKRFEAAGRIRQAGAMFGMGSGETETLARLSRKKIRTPEEERQVVAIGSRLQASIERASQSGNIAQENMAEQMQAALDSAGIGDVLKKAGNVALTADSGQAGVNRDFAKGASDLVIAAGRLLAWTDGLAKNTIIKAIGIGALGAIIGRTMMGMFSVSGTVGRGLFSTIGGLIGGAFNAVKTGLGRIFGLFNPGNLRGIFGNLGNILPRIGGAITSIGGIFGRLTPLLGMATGLLRRIPLIGAAIDAIGELFTGNVFAAFNADGEGNIAERAGNIAFAMFNGFFGSLGKFADWLVGFFTDDGFNFENTLNRWAVWFKSTLMKGLGSVLDFIPGMGKASQYFQDAAKDSDAVLKQLSADKNATVTSIGEQRNKDIDARKKNATETKALADKTAAAQSRIIASNAGILTSTTGIASDVIATARSVATPAPSPVKSVTQPTVNTPEPATTQTPEEKAAATAAATAPQNDAIVSQLVAMTGLLTSMLTAEQMQAAGLSALASAAGRPVFANNEAKFDLLQGGRTTG